MNQLFWKWRLLSMFKIYTQIYCFNVHISTNIFKRCIFFYFSITVIKARCIHNLYTVTLLKKCGCTLIMETCFHDQYLFKILSKTCNAYPRLKLNWKVVVANICTTVESQTSETVFQQSVGHIIMKKRSGCAMYQFHKAVCNDVLSDG